MILNVAWTLWRAKSLASANRPPSPLPTLAPPECWLPARTGTSRRSAPNSVHTRKALNALRETQLEQGHLIHEQGHRMTDGFAKVHAGMSEIRTLFERIIDQK